MTTPALSPAPLQSALSLRSAYAVCRGIARREAKNFYYAFLALPSAKRNAICAVYAFMRHADDLADDETQPRATRLARLQEWKNSWRAVAAGHLPAGQAAADPVFLALADASRQFQIPLALLDQLIEGTAMDLTRPDKTHGSLQQADTYATFADLYRYCYLVASVVGLVCIRIFGYSDPQAEKLAEELGVAFQLTNILRDVREDAERGRIYLPLEDLAAYGIPQTAFTASSPELGPPSDPLRRLLAFEASRAETFYASGGRLLPLIDADSRPALWVLITIYHSLLRRIVRSNYAVLSQRISVPGYSKVAILVYGWLGVLRARLFARA